MQLVLSSWETAATSTKIWYIPFLWNSILSKVEAAFLWNSRATQTKAPFLWNSILSGIEATFFWNSIEICRVRSFKLV